MINKLKELRETGSEEGFTLIELMIVVVIIGILAAIAIPIFMNQQKAAIVASVKSDVKNTVTNIATALIKAPSATHITATVAPGGSGTGAGSVRNGATVVTTFDVVVSDSGTAISTGGAWNGYWVLGMNAGIAPVLPVSTVTLTSTATASTVLSTGEFGIFYNSISGNTTAIGD